ncbi:MFS transporter [Dietzia sp. PP-33]|jgi:putative MFS transporter|uniref:MFS transporter n=1 Tax=Dietzia sp. PP-33 TaxID=2957500 RepID=UPI0029A0B26F|nr:MFS transporter [Dietzia sp. PP-33]MDX2357993.1 MFS transporter [Dietzia sp. PP-33]
MATRAGEGDGGTEAPSTVQRYIDETPQWRDGTPAGAGGMTRMQSRIWWLASAGKFFEGLIVFLIGVALPLITDYWSLSTVETGLLTAAPLAGIMVGATALGGLSDRFGRRQMFLVEMVLFTLFVLGATVAPGFVVFLICLFGMGIALGCDYPTAHTMISETQSTASRGQKVLSAFAFQAVGAVAGTLVGVAILTPTDSLDSWRLMFGVVVVPAALVAVGRLFIVQSPHWLANVGRVDEAQVELKKLLDRTPRYPSVVSLATERSTEAAEGRKLGSLFRRPWRRSTILASVPWFLQDLGTYGIGIFTPTIIATTLGDVDHNASSSSAIIHNDLLGAEGAAFIDTFLLVGIVVAILLVNRLGRMRLQIIGFVGCAVGLAIAAASTYATGTAQTVLVFGGFILFQFMTNLGPNSMTYVVAGEVFPTSLRGMGAGMAASFAKVGAVLTSFLFPILLVAWGTSTVLAILVGTSLLGAVITWKFRIETTGKSVEDIDSLFGEEPSVSPGLAARD